MAENRSHAWNGHQAGDRKDIIARAHAGDPALDQAAAFVSRSASAQKPENFSWAWPPPPQTLSTTNRTAGGMDRPRSSKQHRRRRLLSHLHVQVPVPHKQLRLSRPGRPSGPPSAPCDSDPHAPAHQDRPASPSLLRSPTALLRSKGHSGLGSGNRALRRPGNKFHYDARSYARNFDERRRPRRRGRRTTGSATGSYCRPASSRRRRVRCRRRSSRASAARSHRIRTRKITYTFS